MKEFYTPAEVAKTLGVSIDRVKQWRARGVIRSAFASGPPEYTRAEVARAAIVAAVVDVFGDAGKFADTIHPDALASVSGVLDGVPPLGTIEVHGADPNRWRPAAVAAIRERLAEVGR